jgi:uncharacterized protein (DUF1501 family)
MQMNRRSFLTASLSGLGLAMLPGRARAALGSPRLVFVFLRGGTDALSLFSPRGTPWTRLQSLRGDVAMTGGIPYTTNLQAHPALTPLLEPSIVDDLGVVLHAGGMTNTRSHFDQMYRIETGINATRASKGFLTRTAQSLVVKTGAIDRSAPHSLLGATPIILHDPARAKANYHDGGLVPRWTRAQRLGMYRGTAAEVGSLSIDTAARQAIAQNDVLASELAGVTLSSLTANHGYDPASAFGGRLAVCAKLMTSSLDPRLLTVDGEQFWDSHANQLTNDATAYVSLQKSIKDLATNLAAFRRDLGNRGLWSNTIVVVMSEFGRTVAANSGRGTDHGRGGLMLLLGGRARPITDSLYAGAKSWTLPGTVDDSTPLGLAVDYRTVLTEILERHLGMTRTAAQAVFGGEATASYLNVLR